MTILSWAVAGGKTWPWPPPLFRFLLGIARFTGNTEYFFTALVWHVRNAFAGIGDPGHDKQIIRKPVDELQDERIHFFRLLLHEGDDPAFRVAGRRPQNVEPAGQFRSARYDEVLSLLRLFAVAIDFLLQPVDVILCDLVLPVPFRDRQI